MSQWVVTIDMATPSLLGEEVLVILDEYAEERHADGSVSARGHDAPGFTVRCTVSEPSPDQAVKNAEALASRLAVQGGVHAAVVSIVVETPQEAERRALAPDSPELLSAPDVAELLCVSRQRVHQLLAERADFPAPYARLGSGPIWARPAIEAFDRRWVRHPGRPAKAS